MYKETVINVILGVWLGLLISDILHRVERHFNSTGKDDNDD